MPRPKGSKNKPKTATATVKRTRKPREKKVNPLHTGKSTWVRPTHYYAIIYVLGKSQEFFTYTEKEPGAYSLCDKLNAEGKKGRYVVHKLAYNN